MEVLERIKIVNKPLKRDNNYQIIILNVKPKNNSFAGSILGKTLPEWVALAIDNKYPYKVVDFDEKNNILSQIKPQLDTNYDYTIVLSSTTPLLNTSTIDSIVEYISTKQISLCKLPVGYAINTRDFLGDENIFVDSVYSQNIDDFYIVETKKQYLYAQEILQDRINTFHINNGVEIINTKTVYIEVDVDIDKGVIIYSGNTLKGKTKLHNNVILKENNTLSNVIVGKNSCVSSSIIEDSVLGCEVYIYPFCDIKNTLIGDNCLIERGVSSVNYNITSNSVIKANSVLN